MEKTYLGDGVYASFDGYHIVLTTENGIETPNTICLEGSVINALVKYRDDLILEISRKLANETPGEKE